MAEQPGWYFAKGDPEGTTRYWDGSEWQGEAQAAPNADALGMKSHALVEAPVRIIGRLIDWALTGLVVFPLWLGARSPDVGFFLGLSWKRLAVIGGLLFVWDALWIGLLGASPGKLIMGYRVVSNSDDPNPSIVTGALRAVHRLFMAIPGIGEIMWLLVGLASVGLMFISDSKQSVMDRFAGTKVTATS